MVKLNAKNTIKYFAYRSHRLRILGGVNLNVRCKCLICFMGPCRCDNSAFLRIMAGLARFAFTLFYDFYAVKTGPLVVSQKCMLLLFVTCGVAKAAVSKVMVFDNKPLVIKNESEDRYLSLGICGDENSIGLQRQMLVDLRPKVKKKSENVYNNNNNSNNNKKYTRPDTTKKQHITTKEATT